VLKEFLRHLNVIHQNVKFTLETENRDLPFLDVLVTRRFDGMLGHMVYKRPTHTALDLHVKSVHHLAWKESVY
jgi:hypothetical protein